MLANGGKVENCNTVLTDTVSALHVMYTEKNMGFLMGFQRVFYPVLRR